MQHYLRIRQALPFLTLTAPLALAGGTATPAPVGSTDAMTERFDSAWSLVELYKNPENPVIQKLAFTGRFQYDYAMVEGDGIPKGGAGGEEDLDYDQLNLRRLRAGFKATLFKDFTLHAEGDFNYEEDPIYRRLTDAYVGWKYSDALGIKVGKQSMGYTLDGATSSKELLTIDRNNLTNNLWFTYEYLPGITVSGKSGNWVYNAGAFSQGEENKEFGDLNAGTAWLASVGYDFSKALGADEALLTLDYVYNEETPSTPALFTNRSLGNIVSLNFRYQDGDFGIRSDIAAGEGYLGQSDIFGLTVMPFYNFTDKLQGVLRYTFIESDGDNGLRMGSYESQAVNSGKGDQYQEAYAGLNYFLYGHKLKVQTGLQYVSMRDQANDGGAFDGLSWITGLRLSW